MHSFLWHLMYKYGPSHPCPLPYSWSLYSWQFPRYSSRRVNFYMRLSSYNSSSFKQMRHNSHAMNFTLWSYIIKWVFFFKAYSQVLQPSPCLIREYFDHPRKKCCTHRPSQPTLSSEALTAISLLSTFDFTSPGCFIYMESHNMWPFVSGLSHFSIMVSRFIYVVARFSSLFLFMAK